MVSDLVEWFVGKGILDDDMSFLNKKNEKQGSERNDYIAEIKKIVPFDEKEAEDVQNIISWLSTAPAIHKPANMEEHLGVLCFLLSPDRKQIFMLNHRKAQMWLPPGGHVDEGVTFSEAVELEMQEELGIKARFIDKSPFFLSRTVTRGLNPGHIDVTAWYILEGSPLESYSIYEKEASEARWMDVGNLLTFPEESNLPRATRKLLNMSTILPVEF